MPAIVAVDGTTVEEHEESDTAPRSGIFATSAGNVSDPGAVNLVYVWQGKWKCTGSAHSKSSEQAPCPCMDRVMDRLGLTSDDIEELLQSLEDDPDQLEQEQRKKSNLPRPLSDQARKLGLHDRQPRMSRYYLPEEVESVVFQGLLQQEQQAGHAGQEEAELAAALALDALFMEEKVDTFMSKVSSYLQGERCPTHRCPLALTRSSARLTHTGSTSADHYVFTAKCSSSTAPCYAFYDGNADDLLNLNNSELFSHHLLRGLLARMVRSAVTFHSEWQVLCELDEALPRAQQQRQVSLPLYLDAFFGYVSLLEEGLPPTTCPLCGDTPVALIGDATGYKVFDHHLRHTTSFGYPTAGPCAGPQVSVSEVAGWESGLRMQVLAMMTAFCVLISLRRVGVASWFSCAQHSILSPNLQHLMLVWCSIPAATNVSDVLPCR